MAAGSGRNRGGPAHRLRHWGARGWLALVLSAALPAQALAAVSVGGGRTDMQANGPATSAFGKRLTVDASGKIDPAVTKAFKASDKVTYLVRLRTQADVVSAAESARKAASPAQQEVSARSAVIRALKEAADLSQANLVSLLEKEQEKGTVAEFERYWVTNMLVVTSTQEAMEKVAARPEVEKILPNGEVSLIKSEEPDAVTVDAPSVEEERSVAPDAGADTVEWNIQRVGAPSVWSEFGVDGSGAVVASLDTGVEWTHPALQEQYRGNNPNGSVDHTYSWYDAVNHRSTPYDDHGHGTHTVGTALGRDPEGVNEIGVAPGARWIGVKILDNYGYGYEAQILEAGQWILAPGGDPSKAPDVVNNSWGGGPGLNEWFRDVVAAWRAAGIVPVFANGNDGPGAGTTGDPANYPESIAVGATDSADNVAYFSSRGPSPYSEIKPEISAPGVNIRSSVPGGGYEGGWSGTSMATPAVSGTVALLRSADASLTVDDIEEILTSSADPRSDAAYPEVPNNGYGHGIVNAYNAVGLVSRGVGSISGRVVTGGDDLEPPVVEHLPITEGFKRLPIEVTASISDDVSVTAAYLRFRFPGLGWWGIIDLERVEGDHKGGLYTGVIPADFTTGSTLEYYIEVVDYGGNRAYSGTAAQPHVVQLLDGITAGYRLDFEGKTTGWTHGGANDPWEIGEPTSGPGSAHSGTRVAATNLAGDYANSTDAYLISPPIDLSGGPLALRFWQWYSLENNFDKGYVLASANGGETWDVLTSITGNGASWQEATVDLSAYAGNSTVFVAFYLVTDGSVTAPGWYIDDVELYVDSEAPSAPEGVQAQGTATGAIAVTWAPVEASDLHHYTVYRSTTPGEGYEVVGETSQTAFVDSSVTAGTTYYYAVTASDFFGNESVKSQEVSVTAPEVEIRFRDDMESGTGEWTHSGTNDPWQWGTPTSGPGSAFSGTSLWATNLSGNYSNSTNASLVTPPIDLTGLGSVSLQFAHWYSLEANYDRGYVEVSADGGATWRQLANYTAPGIGGQPVGWEQPLIDLSDYAGQVIQVRFRLQTDSSVNYAGWYIDDVLVAGVAQEGEGVNLSFSSAAPNVGLGLTKPKPAELAKPQFPAYPKSSPVKRDTGAVSPGTAVGINSLPLEATVTVVETGRVVRTDPVDGSYRLTLPGGQYTLQAQAYGYYSQERSVTVADGENVNVSFSLEPVPRGEIFGVVTNSRTEEPVAGALVTVAEDPRVPAVTTDESGRYRVEVLEGNYTLRVSALGYYAAEESTSVPGNSAVELNFALRPFIGSIGEIGYDDGTAENAWAYYAAGNGWGVRMTPEDGKPVSVTGAKVFLFDASWPNPGGNTFQVAIYSANEDGSPGDLLAGPVSVTNAVRGDWNEVEFGDQAPTVTGDFFVVYLQDAPYPNTPGLGVDENLPDTGRNWQLVDGSWSPWSDVGNFMLRALVSYEVTAPVITSPQDGSFTNEAALTVSGTSFPGTTVTLYQNGQEVGQTAPDQSGAWSLDVTLEEGANTFTATATVSGEGPGSGTTDPSAPVTITLDTTPPVLTVVEPQDGSLQNNRVITVSGTAADEYLAAVAVNGQEAELDESGAFRLEVLAREGENQLTVTASDLAGNVVEEIRTVTVNTAAPEIRNLEPSEDQELSPGDTLTVSFTSEPGLALAAFQIVLDPNRHQVGGGAASTELEPGEIALDEVAPGQYLGQWTVPDDFGAAQAYIRVRAVGAAGTEARATASGKLVIAEETEEPAPEPEPEPELGAPSAVIEGPTNGKRRQWLTFSGRASSDPDGQIVSYFWDFGDGSTGEGVQVRHRYDRNGTYTITLTVTDDSGLTDSATHTVTISNNGR